MTKHPLAGIYVASITPFMANGQIDLEAVPGLIRFFAKQGAHGALLAGTTGEGTNLSDAERIALIGAAIKIREDFPDFRILASTGTPSLTQSIALSQQAFALGCDAVLVLPPYFHRNASEEGLFEWYRQIIEQAVPESCYLLAYHIPQISGVQMPVTLWQRLSNLFPKRFAGIKDSSGDLEHSYRAIAALPGKAVLVGNDHLVGPALRRGGAGAITALANLRVSLLREIWDRFQAGKDNDEQQAALTKSRNVLDQNPSAQAFIKSLMPALFDFPQWELRAPLLPFSNEQAARALNEYRASLNG